MFTHKTVLSFSFLIQGTTNKNESAAKPDFIQIKDFVPHRQNFILQI